jgi:hypothetical protein
MFLAAAGPMEAIKRLWVLENFYVVLQKFRLTRFLRKFCFLRHSKIPRLWNHAPQIPGTWAFGFVCLFVLSFPGRVYLHGQSGSGRFVAAEIQNFEKKLADPGIPAAERRRALIGLAGLFRLSGDPEAAARAWTEAAFVEPGSRDDLALVEGARCFAAIGELDKAEAQVQTVIRTGRDAAFIRNARYLEAQIKAFRSGDFSALASLGEDPAFSEYKAAIYYTQWKLSGDLRYKSRLLAEYPESPEARIAGGEGGAVSAAPMALWFLFPGREGIALGSPAAGEGAPVLPNPAFQERQSQETAAGTVPAVLQTGLFSREENARALTERLKRAGFQPDIVRREVKGAGYWAVIVPAGNDMGRTIIRLKDAGFESFPIFQ